MLWRTISKEEIGAMKDRFAGLTDQRVKKLREIEEGSLAAEVKA
jgi:hypothetical protein